VRLPVPVRLESSVPEDRKTLHGGRALRRTKHERKILVVDDNEAAADALGKLLRMRGHDVAIAYGGADALEKVRESEPEVAIVDIQLPDMSGYEVARRNLATVQGAAAATASLLDVVLPTGAGEPERTAFAEALSALNRGDEGPAEALIARLPEAQAPGDMRRAYIPGLIAHRRGENREAAKLLERCYGAARGNALLAFQLAPIERQIGRLDIAIAVLEEAVRALAEKLQTAAGKLIHPLRLAVTGTNVSPGIFETLAVVGKPLTLERIERALKELG